MTDSEIIGLFYERSEQAIAETRRHYSPVIRRTAFHILNSIRDSEECENDTYLTLWNRIPPEQPESFGAYACRIARNIAINLYRYNTAGKRNSTYDVVLDEMAEMLPGGETPESEYETKELTEAIEHFLDMLDSANRVMFVKRYWFSEPVSQIASEMNFSSHTVTVRLSRIRNRLQKYLKGEGLIL